MIEVRGLQSPLNDMDPCLFDWLIDWLTEINIGNLFSNSAA